MSNILDKLYWFETDETDQACGREAPPKQVVGVEDRDAVLDFTYRYLDAHTRPARSTRSTTLSRASPDTKDLGSFNTQPLNHSSWDYLLWGTLRAM